VIESPVPAWPKTERPLLFEDFDWNSLADGEWRVTDPAAFALTPRAGHGSAFELSGDPKSYVRALRTLTVEPKTGRIVRLRVVVRVEGDDVPLLRRQGPRLMIDFDRDTQRVGSPVMAFRSLGQWEEHEQYFVLPDAASMLRISISANRWAGRMAIDDLAIEPIDLALQGGFGGATSWRASNLVIGGDFEVGHKGFSSGAKLESKPLVVFPEVAIERGGPIGDRCLRSTTEQGLFGINFNWLRLRPGRRYTFSFYARATTPGRIRAALVSPEWRSVKGDFALSREWSRYGMTFYYSVAEDERPRFDVVYPSFSCPPGERFGDDDSIYLDGIELHEGENEEFEPPEVVRVGIETGRESFSDLACLWEPGEPIEYTIKAINSPDQPRRVVIRLVVLDAFDRIVDQRDETAEFGEGESKSFSGSLNLPSGLYKLSVNAFETSGQAGGQWIVLAGSAERKAAVLTPRLANSPVSPIGFSEGSMSPLRTEKANKLGVNWVRMEIPANEPLDDGRLSNLKTYPLGGVEIVAHLRGGGEGQENHRINRSLLTQLSSAGVKWFEIGPEWISERPKDASADLRGLIREIKSVSSENQVAWLAGQATQDRSPLEWTSSVLSSHTTLEIGALVVAFDVTCRPEWIWEVFKDMGRMKLAYKIPQIWCVQAPVVESTGYRICWPFRQNLRNRRVQDANSATYPALSASWRAQRSLLALAASVTRNCWSSELLAPMSITDPVNGRSLHEYDHTPKASLLAMNFIQNRLAGARYVAGWLDPKHRLSILTFRVGDRLVTAIWRAGSDEHLELALDFEGEIKGYTTVGTPFPDTGSTGRRRLRVNRYVLYLEVDTDRTEEWLRSLEHLSAATVTSPAS
jgi:hypothetical protein